MNIVQSFVQLDPKLQEVIVWALTLAVAYLILQITQIAPWLGEYLGQNKTAIVTWLSGLVFQLLQNALDQVPTNWESVASLVMQLIVAVIIAFGVFAGLRKFKAPGYAALR